MSSDMDTQNVANIGKLFDKVEALHGQMAGLTVTVSEGFKGVHRRQDITNGRIQKNEDKVTDLKQADQDMRDQVEELIEFKKNEVTKRDGKSNRTQNLIYSILEKIVWIGFGVVLYNGKKLFEIFF